MQIGIIGLGLIGGSLALDLKDQLGVTVLGSDENQNHAKLASELKLVNQVVSEKEIIEKCQVIIVCIPVHVLQQKIHSLLGAITSDQVIIDTGSTKKEICSYLNNHQNRKRYVAAHPLAGTEYSGPTAAIRGLFRGKKNIICDKKSSATDAINIAQQIFLSVGMESYFLDSNEHDQHLAYVSHLSHISSFMLGLTVLNLEKDKKQIANLASTGFESTVRLAKSSPETWAAIFDKNAVYVCEALEQYIEYLNKFLEAIQNKDKPTAIELMQKANGIKHILDNIKT